MVVVVDVHGNAVEVYIVIGSSSYVLFTEGNVHSDLSTIHIVCTNLRFKKILSGRALPLEIHASFGYLGLLGAHSPSNSLNLNPLSSYTQHFVFKGN